MNRIDRLYTKVEGILNPPLSPYERAMRHNKFVGHDNVEFLVLLSTPQDDWRLIVQAMAWNGGGTHGANTS